MGGEVCGDLEGHRKKMSRDVFDEAIVHVNSRLTALMYGLKKVKKVIENLLYPDASGVTRLSNSYFFFRCICCRRPSGISGQEQENAYSPKRPFKPGDDESDHQRFLNAVDAAVSKRPKLDGAPFCATRDTIISIPYSSTTYRTSPEGAVVRKSQVPKLPKINGDTAQAISPKLDRYQKEGKKEIEKPQQPLPSTPSGESRGSSYTDVISESARNLQSFAPMRIIVIFKLACIQKSQ
ncbi:uncharacterized protein CEXT_803241 [Caerostris extrusa]|uniref:Uncharacterized protein n=1 Tax=Caerostris extrusa TaxID=172846 RepID=A0AAV4V6Q0_CAEEX|nr:uncharacterized protein CEXT_803241 [Caerostris extrusa]